ncbi:MAG TPA: hypothetical protein VGK47_09320 [Nitrososphaeraceae archaeon]
MSEIVKNTEYYASELYSKNIMDRVGISDAAVLMIEKLAHDINNECLKEFKESENLMALSLLSEWNMKTMFQEVIEESLKRFKKSKLPI